MGPAVQQTGAKAASRRASPTPLLLMHWGERCDGTSGAMGRAVRWDARYDGTSGAMGRAVRWDERCCSRSLVAELAGPEERWPEGGPPAVADAAGASE